MRTLYYDFQIDDQPVLIPDADLSITVRDLEAEDSGRDESGVMHRFLLRPQIRNMVLAYDTLSVEEYRYLRCLVDGKNTFCVKFRDADGTPASLIGYCAGYRFRVHNAKLGIYRGLELEIQEC